MTPAPATRDVLVLLRRLHARARARVGVLGAVQALAGTVLTSMFAAMAAGWTSGSYPVWSVLILLAAAIVVVALWTERVVLPWRDLGDRHRFRRNLDRAGGHRNLLVAAAEALEQPDRWSHGGVGRVLTERLTVAAEPKLAAANPGRDLDLPMTAPALGAALVTVLLVVLPVLLVPDIVTTGAHRLLHPLGETLHTPAAGLYLESGPEHVTAGEDVELTAVDMGTPRTAAVCEVREVHGGWREMPVEIDVRPPDAPLRRYRVRVEDLAEDIVYRFRRDGMTSVEAQIRVHHPPLFTALAVEVQPPAYTGLPHRDLNPWPSRLEVPQGSTVVWRGTVSHPVTTAGFVTEGDTLPWDVDGLTVGGRVVIRGDMEGIASVIDARGLVNPDPVLRRILSLVDAPPAIWLASRESADGRLPADGSIDLDLLAEDDYGLAGITLLLRRNSAGFAASDTAWHGLDIPAAASSARLDDDDVPAALAIVERDGTAGSPRIALTLNLDASGIDLLPGEALELTAEVRDNRRPGPAARSRSRILRFVVPSAVDLLAEQYDAAEERRDDMADLRERGERMAEDLDRLERELEKNADLDFARRQELEDAVARQQGLQEELSKLTENMRQDLSRLAEHNLADPQLLEKMERVAELLEEIHSDELARLQEQLREAMDQLSEQEIRDAMAEISEQQEDYLQRLDRAIALLEDLRKEQELAGMAAHLEEMMRRQEELTAESETPSAEAQSAEQEAGDEGEQSEGSEADADAARRQEELAEEMAALREQIEAAQERLAAEQQSGEESPAAEAMREALEKALEKMKEESAEQSMRQSAESMKQDSPSSESNDSQHESMRRMASLYHVLKQGQQAMQMAMEEFVGDALRRLAADLLDLSRRQEVLVGAIPSDLRDVRAQILARDQKRLLRGVVGIRDRLEEVLGKSPTLSFQLLQGLDRIVENLDVSLWHLGESWAAPAATSARDGLGAMNHMVMNLLTSAQSQGGGGGGSCPMPSLGQQLEQMAREQAGLNGLADQLNRQLQEQGPSQEARSRMQRLQSDQQGMAGRLGEAAEESRESPDAERLLGDLEELARDMERVSDSLASGTLDEETLRRQERILGRLLDARNSVRRRDYDKRRESRTAGDVLRAQLGDTPEDDDAGLLERRRRQREQVEHVPPDYRDLVRRYFRSVTKDEGRPGEVRR